MNIMADLGSIAVKSLRVLKMLEMKQMALERTIKKSNPEMYKEYMAEFEIVRAECAKELKEIEAIIKNY
jgi:hypothetical protein